MIGDPKSEPLGSPPPQTRPKVDIRQLLTLTDDTGLFQHARLALPDPNHGYCVDDNARALIAAVRLKPTDHPQGQAGIEGLVNRYLTFVTYAIDPQTHCIRNFMSYSRQWLEPVGSHDAQGRALWALAVAAHEATLEHQRELAAKAFREALPTTQSLDSLRTWAFLILALDVWANTSAGENDPSQSRLSLHAEQLAGAYRSYHTADWPWWEPIVTYDNARLPLAMLRAGQRLRRDDYTDIGLASLAWLIEVQTHPDTGHLRVIGNDGWLPRPSRSEPHKPARFDQQPLEAAALIDACAAAYETTQDRVWLDHADRAMAWFLGQNDLATPLIHPETGGCQDGLTPTAVNLNQGAESVLSYIMSCQTIHRLAQQVAAG
ncbi:MAG: hypothetical protein ACIAXF_07395 [Phycisphaerales bacterium JB063]